jgi:two-component system chemotaxis response regulator CheB
MSPGAQSLLPQILARSGPLPASSPEDLEVIRPGHIYIARPDHHLLVEGDHVRVVRGPRENRHRPSIDPLFRSAAWSYGPRVVGVVLTGYLDDGAAGLWAIKSCGGVAVVQDPSDALHHDMPINAARSIALEPVDPNLKFVRPANIETEIGFVTMDRDIADMNKLGALSAFTCPTCRGALWELQDDVLRYRCHTGHAFSKDSLLGEQTTAIEDALYSALRAVEEKATVLRRLGERSVGRSDMLQADFESKASALEETAEVLRSILSREAA